MKKNLVPLTGIVFVLSILLAGSCKPSVKTDEAKNSNKKLIDSMQLALDSIQRASNKTIYITCKAVVVDGILQFSMSDKDDIVVATTSENRLIFVAELKTEVKAKKKVVWTWAESSQVQEFLIISPKETGGDIMRGNAEQSEPDSRKKFKYDIPDDVTNQDEEKYIIQFIWDEETVTIDPYLKLPEQGGNGG